MFENCQPNNDFRKMGGGKVGYVILWQGCGI